MLHVNILWNTHKLEVTSVRAKGRNKQKTAGDDPNQPKIIADTKAGGGRCVRVRFMDLPSYRSQI